VLFLSKYFKLILTYFIVELLFIVN